MRFLATFLWVTQLLAVASTPALAQEQRAPQTFKQLLEREDSNADGKISADEFRGPKPLFQRLDRNNDQYLSESEFNLLRGRGQNPGMRVPEDVELQRDVVFGKGGGRELKMHLVLPKESAEGSRPCFVWIHGGGWQGGTKEGGVRTVTPLVRQGFVGATIEYRLTGEAPFPAQIEDCKCAIRFLRAHAEKYGIDPERIVVGGSSAGGHLAALMGTSGGVASLEGKGGWEQESSRVQAVLDLYGPTDFAAFVTTQGYEQHNRDGSPESKLLGGGEVLSKPEGIKQVNPITYIDKEDPPFLILHGSNDRTVPSNQSQLLHAALKEAGVPSQLHIIEGAGHGGPEFGKPEIQKMRIDFLLQQMKKK